MLSDGTLDQNKNNIGESLFQKSIDENGEIRVDKIEPYFSKRVSRNSNDLKRLRWQKVKNSP